MAAEVKRIKCPNCGAVLDVRNSKNEAVKHITCPQCKSGLNVKFRDPAAEANPTIYPNQNNHPKDGGRASTGDETKYKGLMKNAYLVVDGTGYRLSEGANVVGRKAATSQASLQIDTPDHYMSRQHAQIELYRLPDGGLKAVITNYQNKNATTVNGMVLQDGDAIVLVNGYKIVMGDTVATYVEK